MSAHGGGARDEILGRLQARRRPTTLPAPWTSRRDFPDLAARFTTALQKVKGEVHRAASLDDALTTLDALLEELGAARVVANDEPPLNTRDLAGRWPALDWHRVDRDPGDLRAFCAAADVGLTGAHAALAETGSVLVSGGPGRSRLAYLLPPVHIALVAASQLTPDIFTWTAARGGPPPASITLVSGPSKTADIEQTMAVGVHGPKRFIVILYGD